MSIRRADAGENFESVSPRAYTIENCIITSNDGQAVEVKDLVEDIKIHESLNRSSLITEIYLNDAANLLFHMKLAGNEKVELLIARLEPGDVLKEFSLVLQIVDITNFTDTSPSSRAYTLVCMTKHVYLDKEKLLNKPFKGNINELVENIVKFNLKSEIDIRCSTKGSITGIYPKLSPLNAISWLLRNAFDNNTRIYFYETAAEGFVLTSYNSILNEDVYKQYNRIPFSTQTLYNTEQKHLFKEEQLRIIKFQSSLDLSKLDRAAEGAFASTLNTIDIARKHVRSGKNATTFRYGTRNKKLNKLAPINNSMQIDGKKMIDWKKYKQYYVSKNSLAYGTKKNYHEPIGYNLLLSNSNFQNLDTTKMTLVLPGDFDMSPGKIISLIAPIQADITLEMAEGKPFVDGFVSGHYLVSTVTHHFSANNGYTINLNLKKDSFIKQLQG